jgi:hypothetical protein
MAGRSPGDGGKLVLVAAQTPAGVTGSLSPFLDRPSQQDPPPLIYSVLRLIFIVPKELEDDSKGKDCVPGS